MFPYSISNRSAVDRTYVPGDFRDDIAFYKGKTGNPREYVPSGYLHPDYSVLKGPRLDYYLWWRTAVEKGIEAETDAGYMWLRCTELVNSQDDPLDVLRSLMAIERTLNRWDLALLMKIEALISEYVMVKGLYKGDMPEDISKAMGSNIWFWSVDEDVTWSLTRYPIREPADDSWWTEGCYDWFSAGVPDVMHDVLMMSLEGIDEYCRSTIGMGVVRASGQEWMTRIVDPFKDLMKFEPMECMRVPLICTSQGSFHELVNSIIKQATAFMRNDGKKGPTVPKTFPKEYRKIVAAAVDAVMLDEDWDPKMFRVGNEGYWEDDDLDIDLPGNGGKAFIRSSDLTMSVEHNFCEEDFESHWNDASDTPVEYTPSYQLNPVPSTMSPEQLAFYVYWRTMARRGVFLDTDRGYVWLFCTELINHDDDPVAVQDMLNRMLNAYETRGSYLDTMAETAVEHALHHGLDTRIIDTYYLEVLPYLKLNSDPIGAIHPATACILADWDFTDYLGYDYDLYIDALTAAYRAMDDRYQRMMKKRLVSLFGKGRMSTMDADLYESLWLPEGIHVELKYRRTVSAALKVISDGIARVVVRMVNKHIGGPTPRASPAFSEDDVKIVEAAVQKVLDDYDARKKRRTALRQATSISIDRDAVTSATADLEAVTGMMAVEEEAEVVEKAVPVKAPKGWDALSASLDDVEKAYLKCGRTALKGTGRRSVEVEGSINSKAMDAIGDAIVENGTVFEDYADDVDRMLDDRCVGDGSIGRYCNERWGRAPGLRG